MRASQQALLRRARRRPSIERAHLPEDGEYWTVGWEGRVFRLKASRPLRPGRPGDRPLAACPLPRPRARRRTPPGRVTAGARGCAAEFHALGVRPWPTRTGRRRALSNLAVGRRTRAPSVKAMRSADQDVRFHNRRCVAERGDVRRRRSHPVAIAGRRPVGRPDSNSRHQRGRPHCGSTVLEKRVNHEDDA